ncbi:ribonuclease P protein component [Maribacter polysiphoniae]|uniref:ribonuclease P protein component n=1 Tax=Maribacter polysiphoniae TaxID=429344 RepID=UPI001CBDCCDA|nr:ribonuclease P protein component [Maribacter polysiphoniae]
MGISLFRHNIIKTNNVIKHNFSFPKKEKLKSKKLIERLFKEGKHLNGYPLKLLYLELDSPMDVRIKTGVAVPKKKFKSAVQRNRIKRLLRESYRLNKQLVFNNSEGNFAFLILYLGKEMPSYPVVEKGMQTILQKFIKKIDNAKVD